MEVSDLKVGNRVLFPYMEVSDLKVGNRVLFPFMEVSNLKVGKRVLFPFMEGETPFKVVMSLPHLHDQLE